MMGQSKPDNIDPRLSGANESEPIVSSTWKAAAICRVPGPSDQHLRAPSRCHKSGHSRQKSHYTHTYTYTHTNLQTCSTNEKSVHTMSFIIFQEVSRDTLVRRSRNLRHGTSTMPSERVTHIQRTLEAANPSRLTGIHMFRFRVSTAVVQEVGTQSEIPRRFSSRPRDATKLAG